MKHPFDVTELRRRMGIFLMNPFSSWNMTQDSSSINRTSHTLKPRLAGAEGRGPAQARRAAPAAIGPGHPGSSLAADSCCLWRTQDVFWQPGTGHFREPVTKMQAPMSVTSIPSVWKDSSEQVIVSSQVTLLAGRHRKWVRPQRFQKDYRVTASPRSFIFTP